MLEYFGQCQSHFLGNTQNLSFVGDNPRRWPQIIPGYLTSYVKIFIDGNIHKAIYLTSNVVESSYLSKSAMVWKIHFLSHIYITKNCILKYFWEIIKNQTMPYSFLEQGGWLWQYSEVICEFFLLVIV